MASSHMEFLALRTVPLPLLLCTAVMCRSPTGCISLAYRGGLLARGKASGKIEVQFLEHSFQSTEMACTTTPWPGGSFGKLPLALADWP